GLAGPWPQAGRARGPRAGRPAALGARGAVVLVDEPEPAPPVRCRRDAVSALAEALLWAALYDSDTRRWENTWWSPCDYAEWVTYGHTTGDYVRTPAQIAACVAEHQRIWASAL